MASSALLASSTLVVLSVGAGVAFVSNDARFGPIASMAAHLTASMPAFLAAWTGLGPLPDYFSHVLHNMSHMAIVSLQHALSVAVDGLPCTTQQQARRARGGGG